MGSSLLFASVGRAAFGAIFVLVGSGLALANRRVAAALLKRQRETFGTLFEKRRTVTDRIYDGNLAAVATRVFVVLFGLVWAGGGVAMIVTG